MLVKTCFQFCHERACKSCTARLSKVWLTSRGCPLVLHHCLADTFQATSADSTSLLRLLHPHGESPFSSSLLGRHVSSHGRSFYQPASPSASPRDHTQSTHGLRTACPSNRKTGARDVLSFSLFRHSRKNLQSLSQSSQKKALQQNGYSQAPLVPYRNAI